jgi:predicted Fe-S protein YdhL (DUF1289 family)
MKSPCIKVCRVVGDVCVGCNRTLEEIRLWSTLSDVERDTIMRKITMSELNLSKVNERVEIYRYSNGFMVELSGRTDDGDWKTNKMVFDNADEAYNYAKELHTTLPLDD